MDVRVPADAAPAASEAKKVPQPRPTSSHWIATEAVYQSRRRPITFVQSLENVRFNRGTPRGAVYAARNCQIVRGFFEIFEWRLI